MTGTHSIELAVYSAILVVTPCPQGRPWRALTSARKIGDHIVDLAGMRNLSETEAIAAFFGVNDITSVFTRDDGIRRFKKKGRSLYVQVVVPTWCLNQTTDEEFQEVVTASVLYCLVMAARRVKMDVLPIWREYDKTLATPRIKELFATLS